MKILDKKQAYDFFGKSHRFDPAIQKTVQQIVSDLAKRGDQALADWEKKFHPFAPANKRVAPAVLEQAFHKLDPKFVEALAKAKQRIVAFHQQAVPESWQTQDDEGLILGQRVSPIDRVGVYIPGGSAVYPSSVLMNVIPAQLAQVPEIVLVSPVSKNARSLAEALPDPTILGTAHFLGVEEVYCLGGAQAIAALAFGTESIRPVNMISGPGNAFVMEAKRQVYGYVGIDSVAGPSEILIWVHQQKVEVDLIARDLLAQAEHDPAARTILISDDRGLIEQVSRRMLELAETALRKEILAQSVRQASFAIELQQADEAVELINLIAPEHLEVFADRSYLSQIRNAGAIFVGNWSAEVLGDYGIGPNHTLPTLGTAKFSSPLSVQSFLKTSSYIEGSRQSFLAFAPYAEVLAEFEGLECHRDSLRARYDLKT